MVYKQVRVLDNVYFRVYFDHDAISSTVVKETGKKIQEIGGCVWLFGTKNANYTIKTTEKENTAEYLAILFLTEQNNLDLPENIIQTPVEINKIQDFS